MEPGQEAFSVRRLLLFALLSWGCTRLPTAHPSSPAHVGATETSPCVVEGRLQIGAGSALFVDPTSNARRARFTGADVGVRVTAIGARVEVVVAAPAEGPALRLRGHLERHDVPFVAAGELELVPGHAWIAAGAPIEVVGTKVDRATITPHTIQRFSGLGREVSCGDLALGRGGAPTLRPIPASASPFHLVNGDLVLHDAGGAKVGSFVVGWPEGTTLFVLATDGARSHVVLEDWVRLDAWIDSSSLAKGEGADCDDCRGAILDVDDACDEGGSGCPTVVSLAARQGLVRGEPSSEALAIGSYDQGARLVVLERDNGFGRVVPDGGGFVGALWVSLDDLDP